MHCLHKQKGEGQRVGWQTCRAQICGFLHIGRHGDVGTSECDEGVQVRIIQDPHLDRSAGQRYRYTAGQPHHQLRPSHRDRQVHPQNRPIWQVRKKRSGNQPCYHWRCPVPGQPQAILQHPNRGTPSGSIQDLRLSSWFLSINILYAYHYSPSPIALPVAVLALAPLVGQDDKKSWTGVWAKV